MILEVAILHVKPNEEVGFEHDFGVAQQFIAAIEGYLWHELRRCVDEGKTNQYVLLVGWRDVQSHTVGFRHSPQYSEWKRLLHHYYSPFPTVEHYGEAVFAAKQRN